MYKVLFPLLLYLSVIGAAFAGVDTLVPTNGSCLAEYEGKSMDCKAMVVAVVTTEKGEKRFIINFVTKRGVVGFGGSLDSARKVAVGVFFPIEHFYSTSHKQFAVDPPAEKYMNGCLVEAKKTMCSAFYNDSVIFLTFTPAK